MKTTWKYTLSTACALSIPKGAQLLDVQMQGSEPQLWALVDPTAEREIRRFHTFGTGRPIPDIHLEYVATFQMHGGEAVFHVFEERTR